MGRRKLKKRKQKLKRRFMWTRVLGGWMLGTCTEAAQKSWLAFTVRDWNLKTGIMISSCLFSFGACVSLKNTYPFFL